MHLHFTFKSSSFPPAEGEEDELINEGIYGKNLITWFQSKLSDNGIKTKESIAEDFGWFAYLDEPDISGGIACSVIAEDAIQSCHLTIDSKGKMLKSILSSQTVNSSLKHLETVATSILNSHQDIVEIEIEKS